MTNPVDRLTTALAGRYTVERELGAGGMATVYLAEDVKHHRKVALKVLRPELAAILGAERFLKEIEVTANLQHPNILPLYDSGRAAGPAGEAGSEFLYYVMPYVEGETLRDKMTREKQLGVDETIAIAKDVADALHFAHQRSVVHRDIKPENILLQQGKPLVADFGIALAVS
ncbi:MAG: serine/threonine protein kinase, partial [Gemmatimonadota bacterium]|nr:serine/threonine protein kinase [Gemmatimonadota bacterium]